MSAGHRVAFPVRLARCAAAAGACLVLGLGAAACSPTPATTSGPVGTASLSVPASGTPVVDATSPVDGILTDIDSEGLTQVTAFTIRTNDGQSITFKIGTLENGAEFPPGHLAEHLATSSPVRVYFRAEGPDLVVYRLEDAPGELKLASPVRMFAPRRPLLAQRSLQRMNRWMGRRACSLMANRAQDRCPARAACETWAPTAGVHAQRAAAPALPPGSAAGDVRDGRLELGVADDPLERALHDPVASDREDPRLGHEAPLLLASTVWSWPLASRTG